MARGSLLEWESGMNVRTIIALAVTFVWVSLYMTAIVNANFHPPVEVNAVMLLVAGFFFSGGIKKGKE